MSAVPTSRLTPELVKQAFERIRSELEKSIAGQASVVNTLLVSLFCQGHCLLVGVPGLAKTLLARSLAQTLGLQFNRIQFTPDLMPGDILGTEILRDRAGRLEFDFQLGPVFANLILADEINRTPPKTQSALLEAMQERRVTVARETRNLPLPFMVIATQNPIEHEGTYPLPEAQLDRFMFSIHVGYPGKEVEMEIVKRTTQFELPTLQPVVTREELLGVQELVRAVPVADHLVNYAVTLSSASRPTEADAAPVAKNYIEWGAGPRASQYLIMGAKALALMSGKAAPEAADIRAVAPAVLQHRVVLNYRATGEGVKSWQVVQTLLKEVPEPTY